LLQHVINQFLLRTLGQGSFDEPAAIEPLPGHPGPRRGSGLATGLPKMPDKTRQGAIIRDYAAITVFQSANAEMPIEITLDRVVCVQKI